MSRPVEDPFRFRNLKGMRTEWRPPLGLKLDTFWETVKDKQAVFIPVVHWRGLILQGNIISTVSDMVMFASGEWPVGIKHGVHIYTDAFSEGNQRYPNFNECYAGHDDRLNPPITIVHQPLRIVK